MSPRETKSVLLIHAIESEDPEDEVIPTSRKRAAGREAGSLDADADASAGMGFILKRAQFLEDWLTRRYPNIAEVTSKTSKGWFLGIGLILAAFVLGLLSNQLGSADKINLLAFPLIGMLAWNILVYLWELIRWGLEFRKKKNQPERARPLLDLLIRPAALELGDGDPLSKGLSAFSTNWFRWSVPIQKYRLRSLLHVAAGVMAATMVGGMYVKGLSNDYRAIWESTFLNESTLHAVFSILLKPASILTGLSVPSLEQLAAMRQSPGNPVDGGRADLWIHLYAATVLIFVIVPRFFFAASSWMAASVVSRRSDVRNLDRPYFDKLLRHGRGTKLAVEVIPYSCDVNSILRQEVDGFAKDKWGGGAVLKFQDVIPYGHEEELSVKLQKQNSGSFPQQILVLFNFASTPEVETNGALIKGIRDALRKVDAPTDIHVLLDLTSFRKKLGGLSDFEEKMNARLETWCHLAEEYSVEVSVIEAEIVSNQE